MAEETLQQAAIRAGIATHYKNMQGEEQSIDPATLKALLAAMSKPEGANHPDAPIPAVKVFTAGKAIVLPIAGNAAWQWKLQCEDGTLRAGAIHGGDSFKPVGKLPNGYHTLTLAAGTAEFRCQLIVAPKRCYQPEVMAQGKKLWGACVQLYSLRSDHNWGIGDFSDLREMLLEIAGRGGDFVGVNPLHALFPSRPEHASPYSPSSRRWLNPLYIDVGRLEDFTQCAAAQRWWRSKATRQALEAVRATDWVDYTGVAQLKMAGLRLAWAHFQKRKDKDTHVDAFNTFSELFGQSLYWQATFDALHHHQIAENPDSEGWSDWPQPLQDVNSPEVLAFCRDNREEIRFWQWLQWLAWEQLMECWSATQQAGMAIGLYRDLAVGVSRAGSQTWHDRSLYCMDISVGAPPDALGPQGQNWSLPPLDPQELEVRAYQPFISLIRANMACCGALRIDHVMSLLRLWWIPKGQGAESGAYVHYPVDDLLAILALESQRHRCLVIGEDLGTVPQEIIGKLRAAGIYSYKVLYFEHNPQGVFRRPDQWPAQAIAVTSTHDLPTLRGYWQADDLSLGKKLGIYSDQQILDTLYRERDLARQALLDSLHRFGCLPARTGRHAQRMSMTPTLSRGLQRYVALSDSRLMGLQPEDWLAMATPVNVPGTSDEYSNWRRKLISTLEVIFADRDINRLLKDLTRFRRKRG